ncbi:MAG: desulfoferrodoxin [Proteobacteria bacterium]|nr:desulfoferrodoxin [Pseudomonadota bacterium]MBU1138016.1 desulfoferrodoxin [Pseudomonadota bacterium]MBU1233018.1 desulfoferrodoxin [Pseudomonadota bacterium]MBU1420811.1 desulfoferrodoxin [Pseudomonadota bacterium]
MAEKLGIYKCNICGNIVEVLHAGGGDLSCCGAEMVYLSENTVDAAKEKHVPVIEKVDGGYKVSVGSVAHPMTDEHYIEWIELIAGDTCYRQFLNPGDTPEAFFPVSADSVIAREHCNLHGVWKA